MFQENSGHLQTSLFSAENMLSDKKRKKLESSEEHYFYELIFCKIPEDAFACLYSDKYSRPNAPINAMVACMLLRERYGWTFARMFDQIDFNLLVRVALGLNDLDETPFVRPRGSRQVCPATFFNFQNRLASHYGHTGENLLEVVFDHLTAEQLEKLKIKSNIQRTDSLFAASNIRQYSRVQLLVEVLLRLNRVLTPQDRKRLEEQAGEFLSQTSSQFIYRLPKDQIAPKLERLGQCYHWVAENLLSRYTEMEIFQTFQRVYAEHFSVAGEKLEVVPTKELSSGVVQSPDDLDAAYRNKNGKTCRGQAINVTETCHPDNQVNLVTDVAVNACNQDDGEVLEERLDKMVEKTPDLEELHHDGGYGNAKCDHKMEQLEITPIQTGIKGPKPAVSMEIKASDDGTYKVKCPQQSVTSDPTGKKHKAVFDKKVCVDCACASACPATETANTRTLYFTEEQYLARKRHDNVKALPEARQKLRANVEATVSEFKRKMQNGKLKVRGAFKTRLFALSAGIGINFGRILRHLTPKGDLGLTQSQLISASTPFKAKLSLFLATCEPSKKYFSSIHAFIRKMRMICRFVPVYGVRYV